MVRDLLGLFSIFVTCILEPFILSALPESNKPIPCHRPENTPKRQHLSADRFSSLIYEGMSFPTTSENSDSDDGFYKSKSVRLEAARHAYVPSFHRAGRKRCSRRTLKCICENTSCTNSDGCFQSAKPQSCDVVGFPEAGKNSHTKNPCM